MGPSSAYQRFRASMVLDFEKWHDGTGFDLTALAEMSAEERRSIAMQLRSSSQTWREVEAMEALQNYPDVDVAPISQTLESTIQSSDRDTRLAAAETLHRQGKLPDFDKFLAKEITELTGIGDGSVRALLLAEEFPSERVKLALLYASKNRTSCSVHCAALLCFLCGKAAENFDWSMRPFFLQFGEHENSLTRSAAFDELCKLTGLESREPWDFLA